VPRQSLILPQDRRGRRRAHLQMKAGATIASVKHSRGRSSSPGKKGLTLEEGIKITVSTDNPHDVDPFFHGTIQDQIVPSRKAPNTGAEPGPLSPRQGGACEEATLGTKSLYESIRRDGLVCRRVEPDLDKIPLRGRREEGPLQAFFKRSRPVALIRSTAARSNGRLRPRLSWLRPIATFSWRSLRRR